MLHTAIAPGHLYLAIDAIETLRISVGVRTRVVYAVKYNLTLKTVVAKQVVGVTTLGPAIRLGVPAAHDLLGPYVTHLRMLRKIY